MEKMKKITIWLGLLLLLSMVISACGGGTPQVAETQPAPV
jgi:hypothetical protein